MLLTITTTRRPATDLGYILVKHPARVQKFDVSFGVAHVFYPEANENRCTAALVLDIDAVGMVRRSEGNSTIGHYINDRPYVASSLLSTAISKVFGSALSGNCKDRPELASEQLPLEATLSAVSCRAGEEMIRRLFEPLGYEVHCQQHQFDPEFAEWGDSPYFTVVLTGTTTVQALLSHLYVLVPVLDNDKHYRLSEAEVDKLLKHGESWLSGHPEQRLIVRRYLGYRQGLTEKALELLSDDQKPEDSDDQQAEGEIERKLGLHEQRHAAVLQVLNAGGARSVLDMGCSNGKLLKQLAEDERFTKLSGFDVSAWSVRRAQKNLGLSRRKANERIDVFLGSLVYDDERFKGFDAATCIEVIEHLEPDRLADFERVVFACARPATLVITTPNREYNVRFEWLVNGGLRHRDHRFEWSREEFWCWATAVADRHGYSVSIAPVGPEDPEVGAPSQMAVFTRGGSQAETAAERLDPCALNVLDVLETPEHQTRLLSPIRVAYRNRLAAFENASRFTVNPRWLIYLPPTMSPCETSSNPGFLEHPEQALDYYKDRGVSHVICEEKHMGSRAVVIVCRDSQAARTRFGVDTGEIGVCYTRMGRRFFDDRRLEASFLQSVSDSLTAAGIFEELTSDWVALDCELMPWSAKAQGLIKGQYAAVGASASVSLNLAVESLKLAASYGCLTGDLLQSFQERQRCVERFRRAYGNYCWPVNSLSDYRLAPFHILASEGAVHCNRDHLWHMRTLARMAACSNGLIIATQHRLVNVHHPAARKTLVDWWMEHTASGGEGMVVKPLDFVAQGFGPDGQKRLVQPAVKCRGQEYLRIIYGPDYTLPHNLERLRNRALKGKRWLAIREFALGLEALERFVRGGKLSAVHQCVYGVLALEHEPIDPRL